MTSSSPPTLNLVSGPLADVEADLLVVTCAQDETLSGKAAGLDGATDGLIQFPVLEWIVQGTRLPNRVDLPCSSQVRSGVVARLG